jgi:hypothetical protein
LPADFEGQPEVAATVSLRRCTEGHLGGGGVSEGAGVLGYAAGHHGAVSSIRPARK